MRASIFAPIALFCLAGSAAAADDFRPDPFSVRRHGSAYRYPQAGWIILHIEGEPYDRGYQHGQLLAPEIAGYLRCFAAIQNSKAPTEGWKTVRTLVSALFLRRFDKEYLEEMKGIAAGASDAGARFDGRALDLLDVVALNCWAEIETLDSALEATPVGLEGIRFPARKQMEGRALKPMHCSAFAATGPATRDGKIVFGHNTMFDLYPSLFYNVWLDVKPSRGHRVLMQTFPGGIQSGMDYYMNDAGLLVCETTIGQTRFDPKGMTLASRIRQAMQYADSIDKAVAILRKDNNGLYTNEWLLADIKTNEIAMFELGTARDKLYRSSKGEWFGGTEGFYWGCNNAKDLEVRLDTVASVNGKPANVVWKPSDRDRKWQELYARNKGKIDADFGKLAFSTPPLTSSITLDAKYTTSDLARQLKTHALYGPPLGKPWLPTDEQKQNYPEIRALVGNPWTLLHPGAPPSRKKDDGIMVVDLPDKIEADADAKEGDKGKTTLSLEEKSAPSEPAWFGTLLPKTGADVWLATAFADYERYVALEKTLEDAAKEGKLSPEERDRLAVDLYAHRSKYLAAARVRGDVPLARTKRQTTEDEWYRIASGKGVLLLHELRRLLGDKEFTSLMDAFGKEHAGKEVTAAQFRAHVEKGRGKELGDFFDFWLNESGMRILALGGDVKREAAGKGHRVIGEVGGNCQFLPGVIEVTLETDQGEESTTIRLERAPERVSARFDLKTESPLRRIVINKYGGTTELDGGAYSILSFQAELEQTLIVYGTSDEAAANRETARVLQEAIRSRWSNLTVPIKSDDQVKFQDLKSHHLLLIGRPDCNAVVEQARQSLPIVFGRCSFTVRRDVYAHMGSAVVAAAENPFNKRFSVVVLAGLSGEATYGLPTVLIKKDQKAAEVLVVPSGGKARALVVPDRSLGLEFAKDPRRGLGP